MHSWPGTEEAPGVVRCHEHGLEAVRAINAHGSLLVFCHGAQLVDYTPEGRAPVLWLSRQSRFENGVAIRGGVPICFPWFGAHASDPKKPAHGFARTRPFRYLGSSLTLGTTKVSFELVADEATRALWPFEFRACLHAVLGPELVVEFEVENRDQRELDFEEALHTYFSVGDIGQVALEGLEGAGYADKVAGMSALQRESRLTFTSETDRVYQSSAPCRVVDGARGREIVVDKSGSATTVVWNPWIEKARRMSDFGDDEYTAMLCVESANTGDARVRLAPGEKHTLRVTISSR